MRNIRLTISYDGTRYRGWQRLGDSGNTVQGKMEAVLCRLCGEEINLIGSGRTDAGVHAAAQVANFHTRTALSCEEMLAYLYQYLPEDIVVYRAEEVEEGFHARYRATGKTYRYRIDSGPFHDPLQRRFALHEPHPLDLSVMRQAAGLLCGEQDFAAFTDMKSKKKSTVRIVHRIEIVRQGRFLDLVFTGNGFLLHMVRILSGSLLRTGRGELTPVQLQQILLECNRSAAGPLLPPKGLCLTGVEYR